MRAGRYSIARLTLRPHELTVKPWRNFGRARRIRTLYTRRQYDETKVHRLHRSGELGGKIEEDGFLPSFGPSRSSPSAVSFFCTGTRVKRRLSRDLPIDELCTVLRAADDDLLRENARSKLSKEGVYYSDWISKYETDVKNCIAIFNRVVFSFHLKLWVIFCFFQSFIDFYNSFVLFFSTEKYARSGFLKI